MGLSKTRLPCVGGVITPYVISALSESVASKNELTKLSSDKLNVKDVVIGGISNATSP